jgi:hypothetical protein
MEEKDYTDEELAELDTYLKDEWNYSAYEELCDDEEIYKGLYEPLEFFRLFYKQVAFIEANQSKPLFVARQLKQLNYTDEQLNYLYSNLTLCFENEESDQLKICCREISKLRDKLVLKLEENETNPQSPAPYDFKEVLKHLETLTSAKEKISYLIEKKTTYEQNTDRSLDWESPSFADKCALEIDKIQKLSNPYSPPKKEVFEPKIVEVGKHKDLTIDRTILLLNRLIPLFSECDATKKAEFINFLTGFDYETVRQRFSSIHKKDADKPQAFEKDMEIVCKYLNMLVLCKLSFYK